MKIRAIRIMKVVGISYLTTYVLIVLLWTVLPLSSSCTVGQEIEEGCRAAFPETYSFLAVVNISIAIPVSITYLSALAIVKRLRKTKS